MPKNPSYYLSLCIIEGVELTSQEGKQPPLILSWTEMVYETIQVEF